MLAEALYLANLLVLPVVALIALCWLQHRHRNAPSLARNHLRQTVFVSLWGGLLLALFTLLFLALGGWHQAWTWVVVILYFTCVHSALVVFGTLGLARALAGKPFRFPLIGPPLEH